MALVVVLPPSLPYSIFCQWMDRWQTHHDQLNGIMLPHENAVISRYCQEKHLNMMYTIERPKSYDVIGFDLDVLNMRECRHTYRQCFNYFTEEIRQKCHLITEQNN